jgi:nucleoside-diphosphate-sugar epimerase
MASLGAFDEAVKGCSPFAIHIRGLEFSTGAELFRIQGVIHTASIVSFSPDPFSVIPQTILGVTSLLSSAYKEPSIKSFVYTSSSVAVVGGGGNEDQSIDDSSWNNAQIKEAWSVTAAPFLPSHPFAVYGAGKAEAEMALWKFVKEEKPHFQVNSILPKCEFR